VLPWSDSSIAERHARCVSRSQSNLMHNKKHCQPYATSIGYDMIVDIPSHHAMYSHTSCLPPTSLERWQRTRTGFNLHISTLLPDFCNALPRS
jgi:hypothetical protein